jgi:hypothetical protein
MASVFLEDATGFYWHKMAVTEMAGPGRSEELAEC